MSKFFSRLSYSIGNEDWRTEQEALKLKADDRILCITASGDRPLNLLLNECKEIVALDANPIQNYLLNLKCIAMQELDYSEYLAFLGEEFCDYREKILRRLLPYLNENARQYWTEKQDMIRKGILYQGLLEKQCQRLLAPFFKTLRQKKIKHLFNFSNIEEQRAFVRSSWDKFYWKKTFDFALNPIVSRLLLRLVVDDPGIYDHRRGVKSIGTYFYKKMNDGFMTHLAKESLLFSLIFQGQIDRQAFPPYLTREGSEVIKKRVNRIVAKDMDIVTYLENTPSHSFDAFSLSDVASYLSQKDFVRMMNEVRRVAKPGARFSIRQFLTNHQMPEAMENIFHRDTALEKKLEKEDRCFVYRFMAGTIQK